MAGSFPDALDRRMAWDDDGTVLLFIPDGLAAIEADASQRSLLNSESGTNVNIVGNNNKKGYYCHIFPELRDVIGYFFTRGDGGLYAELETSVDTTNGIDGTWVQQIANITETVLVSPDYRNSVESLTAIAVKGIRVYKSSLGASNENIRAIHIYGKIAVGQTPDRIIILDPNDADAEFTKVFDSGDVPRGQTQTFTIKLKNNSSSLTVNTISNTAEDLYLNAGDWYTFSQDNINFFASLAIGNLGPGATSGLIYVKQVIPGSETLGLQAGRIKVLHVSVT